MDSDRWSISSREQQIQQQQQQQAADNATAIATGIQSTASPNRYQLDMEQAIASDAQVHGGRVVK
jgi:hypothetical protein